MVGSVPLGRERSIWEAYAIHQVLNHGVWIVDTVVKLSREKNWRNYGCSATERTRGGWNKNQKAVFCKGINKKYILCFRVLLERKWLILVQESKWDNEKQWLHYFCFTSVLLTDLSQSVWKEGRFAFKMYWPKLNLILVSIILPSLLIKLCGTKTENLHLIIFWTYGPNFNMHPDLSESHSPMHVADGLWFFISHRLLGEGEAEAAGAHTTLRVERFRVNHLLKKMISLYPFFSEKQKKTVLAYFTVLILLWNIKPSTKLGHHLKEEFR